MMKIWWWKGRTSINLYRSKVSMSHSLWAKVIRGPKGCYFLVSFNTINYIVILNSNFSYFTYFYDSYMIHTVWTIGLYTIKLIILDSVTKIYRIQNRRPSVIYLFRSTNLSDVSKMIKSPNDLNHIKLLYKLCVPNVKWWFVWMGAQ